MKSRMLLSIAVVLSACGADEGAEPAATGQAGAVDHDKAAIAEVAGTFEIRMADGTSVIETINSDGTYVDATAEGTETERGTWRQNGQELCFDPAGDAPEACFAGGPPGPEGSFEVTDDEGKVLSTVRKVEKTEAPSPAPAQ